MSTPLNQAEQVTLARLADTIASAIARKAGSGESVYTATCRALEEHPDIVRAVHAQWQATIRYVPEPGTPAGDELAAWYDRKTFTGD